jgi:tetratricopeptide (TPR) repeat protein
MRIFHFLIGFLVSTSFTSCESPDTLVARAEAEIREGAYRHAIGLLDRALEDKKYFARAYTAKAYCYSQLGNEDSARLVYKQLLRFMPNNTLALYNIGESYYSQNNFEKAVQYLNEALISQGYNPSDTVRTQFLLEESGALDELLGKSEQPKVKFSEIFYALGLSYFNVGKLTKAYSCFNQCVSSNHMIPESYYMMGLCYLSSKKTEKACEYFTKSYSYGDSLAKIQVLKHCR